MITVCQLDQIPSECCELDGNKLVIPNVLAGAGLQPVPERFFVWKSEQLNSYERDCKPRPACDCP